MKKFRGSEFFRQRILVSLLSQRPIIIEDIRSDVSEGSVGLHDHELSLLRLIDNITNGTRTIINRTGTSLRFHPGILKGGTDIKHECTGIRPIGYYLECLLAVCPFTKERLQITLIGSVCMSSNGNAMDPSVDRLCRTVVPVLNRFMDGNEIHVRVIARHAGMDGRVEIRSDPVSLSLKPINLCKCGRVKRIRGLSVGSGGVSTSILNEMIHTVSRRCSHHRRL